MESFAPAGGGGGPMEGMDMSQQQQQQQQQPLMGGQQQELQGNNGQPTDATYQGVTEGAVPQAEAGGEEVEPEER